MTNPSKRPALAIIYTTDVASSSATDDAVAFKVEYKDGTSETFDLRLPDYDMRVAGRTDMCVFALASARRTFAGVTHVGLTLAGTDGWKISNLWVVWLGNGADKRLLLAAPGLNHWLDDASGRAPSKRWAAPYYHPQPAGEGPRLWLIHRTADVGDADTDSSMYLDLRTSGGRLREKLDLSHDDRRRLRSDEYTYSRAGLGEILQALQPGDAVLDNRGTNGWLPDHVLLIGWHPAWSGATGGFRLLGCPDRWVPASSCEHAAWFDRSGCAAHSINWLGDSRLLAGPAMTRALPGANGLAVDVWMWSVPGRDPAATFDLVNADGTTCALTATTMQQESSDRYGWLRTYRVAGLSLIETSELRVKLFGGAAAVDLRVKPPTEASVRLVFTSCCDAARSSRAAEVHQRMADASPDLALFGGDCVYFVSGSSSSESDSSAADWHDEASKTRRHMDGRSRPELIRLMRTASIYATWDDHDFDYNDSCGLDADGEVREDSAGRAAREASARAFRRAWPGAYHSAGTGDAIHGSFRHGPVEVFMTDGRYDRRPDSAARTILGTAQVNDWLLPALAASTAPVLVIVTSSQFLQKHSRAAHDPKSAERRSILAELNDLVRSNPARRVLVLSGDPHFSELTSLAGGEISTYPELVKAASGPYRLLEATSSPALTRDGAAPDGATGEAGRVLDVYFMGSTYLLIDIDAAGDEPHIELSFYTVTDSSQSREARVSWSGDGVVVKS